MKSEARDLRDLALEIEDTCRRSMAYSIAWPAVTALSEYLSLRARIMELEDSQAMSIFSPLRDGEIS